MSGVCGVIDFGAGLAGDALRNVLWQMQRAMIHRGFERDSFWIDAQARVALSDCHLLTSRRPDRSGGASPIRMVCDGEELMAHQALDPAGEEPSALANLARCFADPSQSPVAPLRAIEAPFALALWNDRLKKLLLARDAFDARPLYFASGRGWFAFASELRALRCVPGFDAALNPDAIAGYLTSGSVNSTMSMCREARKVGAGCFVELDCAPLFASAGMISIRASDPASNRVVTVPPPACSELSSSHFHNPHPEPDPLLADLCAAEHGELLRRALLESMQGSGMNSGSAHVMQLDAVADILLAAMSRAEFALPTHTVGVASPAFEDATALARVVARHIGATHDTVAPMENVSELLNRIAIALDEPVAALEAVSFHTIAAFTRMHSPRAVHSAGAEAFPAGASADELDSSAPASRVPAGVTRLLSRKKTRRAAETVPHPALWSRIDLQAANLGGGSPMRGEEAADSAPRSRPPATAPLLNQICMHHSLAICTPLLDHRVARLGECLPAPPAPDGALLHLLRRYLPEQLIQRVARRRPPRPAPLAETALLQFSESMLFEPDSRVMSLTGRIGLRGLLACPAASPRQALDRRWALLVLEAWLRRQSALVAA